MGSSSGSRCEDMKNRHEEWKRESLTAGGQIDALPSLSSSRGKPRSALKAYRSRRCLEEKDMQVWEIRTSELCLFLPLSLENPQLHICVLATKYERVEDDKPRRRRRKPTKFVVLGSFSPFLPGIHFIHLLEKGKGKATWLIYGDDSQHSLRLEIPEYKMN